MIGQINLDSNFGKLINEISHLPENKIFVEIGTWNGQGSTNCIMRALLERSDRPKLYSIECCYEKFIEARSLWNKMLIPKYLDNLSVLNLLYGRLIDVDKIFVRNDLYKLDGFIDDWYTWYDEDIKNLQRCPSVASAIPNLIDVLLLDGGEFSTLAEFRYLEDRVQKYIILDDCNMLKNKQVYLELKDKEGWRLYFKDLSDRNGYAIFKREKC